MKKIISTLLTLFALITIINAQPTVSAPTPTQAAADVISIYSDAYTVGVGNVNYAPSWGQTTVVTFEAIAEDDNIMKYASFNNNPTTFSNLNISEMTFLHVDIWPVETYSNIQLEFRTYGSTNVTKSITLPVLTANTWNLIDIALAEYRKQGITNTLGAIVLKGGSNRTLYIDNLYLYKQTAPLTAAPIPPVRNTADVVSIFSDAYTDISSSIPAGTQTTVQSIINIDSDPTYKFENFDFLPFDLETTDVSNMEFVSFDIWSLDTADVKISLNDGTNEFDYKPSIKRGFWTTIQTPLTEFTGVGLTTLNSISFKNGSGSGTLFVDNIYFFKAPTIVEPAPTPTHAATSVTSIFSDAYSPNRWTGTVPSWGQATTFSSIQLSANNTLELTNFNTFPMQLTSATNVSERTHLHFDIWTIDRTTITVNLNCGASGQADVPVTGIVYGQWTSFDIALSDFAEVNPSIDLSTLNYIVFKGVSADRHTVYLDNIYFYTQTATGTESNNSELLTLFPNPTSDILSIRSDKGIKSVAIYNPAGQIIENKIINKNEANINISHYLAGSYIVSIQHNDGSISTKKVVKL